MCATSQTKFLSPALQSTVSKPHGLDYYDVCAQAPSWIRYLVEADYGHFSKNDFLQNGNWKKTPKQSPCNNIWPTQPGPILFLVFAIHVECHFLVVKNFDLQITFLNKLFLNYAHFETCFLRQFKVREYEYGLVVSEPPIWPFILLMIH